ncbi:MAG: hypothetical protein Q8M37_07785 [Nevskia sp.]|nr:hypothetical protein [Nevskia sp.]
MKKKAFVIALLVASGSVIAAPGAGITGVGRTAALNVFPNLGSFALLPPARSARLARAAAVTRETRFADGNASNNRATALANLDARNLPGLETLGERVNNRADRRADRRALISQDGIAIGDATLKFDSSTTTNSDGSTSRTFTSNFDRETDGSRTSKPLFTDSDASRTVDASGKTMLDNSVTVTRGGDAGVGKIASTVDFNRDLSRSTKVEGTASSDRESSSSRSTDYSGKFDSSRPFNGKPFEISYRVETTPANGETVVRSGDTRDAEQATRPLLRANAIDNAAQRQDNRQDRREARRDN